MEGLALFRWVLAGALVCLASRAGVSLYAVFRVPRRVGRWAVPATSAPILRDVAVFAAVAIVAPWDPRVALCVAAAVASARCIEEWLWRRRPPFDVTDRDVQRIRRNLADASATGMPVGSVRWRSRSLHLLVLSVFEFTFAFASWQIAFLLFHTPSS